MAVTPAGHPHFAGHLSNLSVVLVTLFERTGELDLLTEAVEAGRRAVHATPAADRGRYATNLGNALRLNFECTGRTELLAEAVDAAREAVATTPTGYPHRVRHLSDLVAVLRALYDRTGDKDLLAEAVDVGRQAVAGTPAGHPGRATYLSNLAVPLRKLFEHTGDADLLAEATRCHTQAGGDVAARITVRVNAYRQLARVAQQTAVTRWSRRAGAGSAAGPPRTTLGGRWGAATPAGSASPHGGHRAPVRRR